MYNLLLTLQHLEFFLHYHTLQKISNPFRIRLKPNSQLITQGPSKVPNHYQDKFNTLLKELEKYNIMKQIGSSLQVKPVHGTTHSNPLIILPKGDSINCVLDARHLNSNTEQSYESSPIETLAPQLARANKKVQICNRPHVCLMMKTESNIQVSHLVTNYLLSYEAFMVLKEFPIFLQNKCRASLKPL